MTADDCSWIARLERAEAELRGMRRTQRRMLWAAGLLTAFAGLIVASLPTAAQVELLQTAALRRGTRLRAPVTVVDAAGRPIVQVGQAGGDRGLIVYDAGGKMLCGIGVQGQNRGLAVFDDQEGLVAAVGEGASPDGVGAGRGLTVLDASQKIIGTLGAGSNGANSGRGVSVNDTLGKQLVGLGVWPQAPTRGQIVISDHADQILFAQPPLP